MDDQYKNIGAKYVAVKLKPSVAFTEVAAVMNLLGNFAGQNILDLACGCGFYTRKIKEGGAGRVVGVDLSAAMIEIARSEETANPLGIEYKVADVSKLGSVGSFDIVTAVWLLHYAKTGDELKNMCFNVARNLKKGGRFIAILPNPDFINGRPESEAYDYSTRVLDDNGGIKRVRMDFSSAEPFTIEYTQWPFSAYRESLRLTGFDAIEPVKIGVSPEGVEKMGSDYWDTYFSNPIAVGLTASFRG